MTESTSLHPRNGITLSVIVIAKNEERVIEKCLASVADWADEIILLDSGSDDRTVEIARQYTDNVEVTDWPGYGKQKNRALAKATSTWVLALDADESVTPGLRDEIDRRLIKGSATAYKVPVRLGYFGKYIRSPLKQRPLILFQREGASYAELDVHEYVIPAVGAISRLRHPILHDSYESLAHQQQKLLKYAELWSEARYQKGKRSSASNALLHGLWMFMKDMLIVGCLWDGWRGLLLSIIHANYTFNKYIMLKAKAATEAAKAIGHE